MIEIPVTRAAGCDDLPLPKYMSEGASGLDIHASVTGDMIIEPGSVALVPTGLFIAVPQGYEIQIRPRSGLAAKHGIGILNSPGTIDSDYRGEIKIILINAGQEPFAVTRGLRVAQMVLQKVEKLSWRVVPSLEETVRSGGGFGHTGQ